MKKVVILDYGLGNTLSLKYSLDHLGFKSLFASENNNKVFDCLIIPGVGSYSYAMKLIKKKQLDLVNIASTNNILIIGICLGMQILSTKGIEGGETKGLSLFQGSTSKIKTKNKDKLPRVGWKKTFFKKDKFFSEFNDQKFYYVHSYKVEIKNNKNLIGHSYYGKSKIVSAINYKNIFGFQFHPEKSGEVGLELLKKLIQRY